MRNRLFHLLCIVVIVSACNGQVYLRDGVTDGDTFYLAETAWTEPDTCQLQLGSDNPARASSFNCELTARRLLLQTWLERKIEQSDATDEYLDDLAQVEAAGYLDEYVARFLEKRHWDLPDELETRAFKKWQRKHLPGHEAETRIIGSWNYTRNVSGR
jgi:hypothetical protein